MPKNPLLKRDLPEFCKYRFLKWVEVGIIDCHGFAYPYSLGGSVAVAIQDSDIIPQDEWENIKDEELADTGIIGRLPIGTAIWQVEGKILHVRKDDEGHIIYTLGRMWPNRGYFDVSETLLLEIRKGNQRVLLPGDRINYFCPIHEHSEE